MYIDIYLEYIIKQILYVQSLLLYPLNGNYKVSISKDDRIWGWGWGGEVSEIRFYVKKPLIYLRLTLIYLLSSPLFKANIPLSSISAVTWNRENWTL